MILSNPLTSKTSPNVSESEQTANDAPCRRQRFGNQQDHPQPGAADVRQLLEVQEHEAVLLGRSPFPRHSESLERWLRQRGPQPWR